MRAEILRLATIALTLTIWSVCDGEPLLAGEESESVKSLIRALDDVDHRIDAIEKLEKLGPNAAEAVPALIGLLHVKRDSSEEDAEDVADCACYALGKIGKPALLPLIDMMKKERGELRRNAVETIARLKDIAKPAVPDLIRLLTSDDLETRLAVASTIAAIDPTESAGIPVFIEALKSKDADLKISALFELDDMGTTGAPAIDTIIETLGDPNEEVRWRSVLALAEIGPAAKKAGPALVKRLDDTKDVRGRAAVALGRVGAVMAIGPLVKCLYDKDFGFADDARKGLQYLNKPAVPILIALLDEQNKKVRGHAVEALAKMRPPAAEAIPAALKMLQSKEKRARYLATYMLQHIGHDGPEVILALKLAVESEPVGAADALGRFGPKARSSLSALKTALKKAKRKEVRESIEEAIERIEGKRK